MQGRAKQIHILLGRNGVSAIIGCQIFHGAPQLPKLKKPDLEKLNEFPKMTQLISGGRRIRAQASRLAQYGLSNELA